MRAMRRKRPGKLEYFKLHHDNAPCHRSAATQDCIESLGMEQLNHPAYSPDLSPNDFFLFPTLKDALRGVKMNSFADLHTKVLNVLKSIPKESYRKSMFDWVTRWEKCIKHNGEYFEKC